MLSEMQEPDFTATFPLLNDYRKFHACLVMAAHQAGNFVAASFRRLEHKIDVKRASRRDLLDLDKFIVVLHVWRLRRAIRFHAHNHEFVNLLAAIGNNEIIWHASMKDRHS